MEATSHRASVLLAVRDQCQQDTGTTRPRKSAWLPEQWQAAFVYLFYTEPLAGHDDLLFLVSSDRQQAIRTGAPPYVLIRKSNALPEPYGVSGSDFSKISWSETVLLNLVLQATYQLTVTTCRQDLLAEVASGSDIVHGAATVTRQVYASPTCTRVNLVNGKHHTVPSPSYPDIYFAVDNYDDVFEDLVLHSHDDCFCVVLRLEVPSLTPPTNSLNHAIKDDQKESKQQPEDDVTAIKQQPEKQASNHDIAQITNDTKVCDQPVLSTTDDQPLQLESRDNVDSTATATGQQGHEPVLAAHIQKLQLQDNTQDEEPPVLIPAESVESKAGQAQEIEKQSTDEKAKPVVVFSGYVVLSQIYDYLGPRLQPPFKLPGLLGRLFGSRPSTNGQAERHLVLMNGPGGCGRSEVAVARRDCVLNKQQNTPDVKPAKSHPIEAEDSTGSEPVVDSKNTDGQQQGVVDTNQTSNAAAGETTNNKMPALQCALLSVSMPVSALAMQLLQHYV